MNKDPMIHAKASAIVEVIRKKDLEVWGETFSEANGDDINHFTLSEDELTEALSSLGGEPKCKDCNDSGQVPIGEEQGQLLYADCSCQQPHPSEREVLDGFVEWYDNQTHFIPREVIIDRYLAEKHKTEKK